MEIQLWREILHPYEQAVSEIIIKFVCLRDEFRKNNIYSPIESVTGRVKTVSSILEKMQMKNMTPEQQAALQAAAQQAAQQAEQQAAPQ